MAKKYPSLDIAKEMDQYEAELAAMKNINVQELLQRIAGKSRLIGIDESTGWPKEVHDGLLAMVQLVDMAKKAQIKPTALRRTQTYGTIYSSFRHLMENFFMIRLGEEVGFAFALEYGVHDLLQTTINKLHADSNMRVTIRFVKSLINLGERDLYDRVTIRIDGQFEMSFFDRARYGL